MYTLNVGILAHVDAGKTSLTERLLHTAGVIDHVGSVDHGDTQIDSLVLERQRGITIKSAAVSFTIGGHTINLLDTPGHPDFIAEVERVLAVLDGAVLVVSAVEGVQAQTRVLLDALQRLRVPTLIFVNKIDRTGARPAGVVRDIADRLTPAVVAMGSVTDAGTKAAAFGPHPGTAGEHRTRLVELLAEHDDGLLAAYLDDEPTLTYHRLRDELAEQTARALVHPVFAGSAITGAGIDELATGMTTLLPPASGDPAGPLTGDVFKVTRGPAGDKIAYARLWSGTVQVRDRLQLHGAEHKITGVEVFESGGLVSDRPLRAGRIGRLRGLDTVRVGDRLGTSATPARPEHHFAPPSLETVVSSCDPRDRAALRVALTQLAEQDPLIDVRQDDVREEISVSLYGEVQKEVIEATLAEDFGLAVTFRETTTLCIERPAGTGAAFEIIDTASNPFLATVGLRVDPAPSAPGSVSVSRWSSARCPTRSCARSRRRCTRPSARASTAGRSPTAA